MTKYLEISLDLNDIKKFYTGIRSRYQKSKTKHGVGFLSRMRGFLDITNSWRSQ